MSVNSLRVRIGPATNDPSVRAVKLAWSQSTAPSKEEEDCEFRRGNATEATSAMEAPSPKSIIASAAEAGRKAAPLAVIFLAPSSSRVAI